METKKKKKILNAVMVVMAAFVVVGGVLGVGHIKGWFKPKNEPQSPAESVMTVDRIVGICKIERMGVGYTLKEGDVLQPGDILETANLATLTIRSDDGSVFRIRDNTEIEFVSLNKDDMKFSLKSGSMLVNGVHHMAMEVCGHGYSLDDAIFMAEAHTGSSSVKVFSGAVDLNKLEGETETIDAEYELIVSETNEGTDYQLSPMNIAALSEDTIKALIACGWDGLCFAKADLEDILVKRAEEIKKQQEEAARRAEEEKQSASSGDGQGSSWTPEPSGSGDQGSSGSGSGNDGDGTGTGTGDGDGTEGDGTGTGTGDGDGTGTGTDDGGSTGNDGEDPIPDPPAPTPLTCTIQIVCDTILDNWDNLNPDKAPFVPEDGIILYTTVEFESGNTVFDVLCNTCDMYGIQIEYSWTPIYGSYYIEGINYLYEKDCGEDSGWMYKVNGWFPNYGCSDYEVSDGDVIVWCYSCNGYGEDVQ